MIGVVRPRSLNILLGGLAVLAAGFAVWAMAPGPAADGGRARPALALFSTLPLYWGEAADLPAMVNGRQEPHWARALIEEKRPLTPVDVLSGDSLAPFADLLMAQPRALAPAENVALDDWVRGGGHLLLFADPMLTAHSAFAIGDRRRPQDVVLLSPILGRWGLRLEFDQDQPLGERKVELLDVPVPVDLPGRFSLAATAPDAPAACKLLGGGVAADCRIGTGRAFILADAALLDGEGSDSATREAALSRILAEAYRAD